MCYLFSYKLLAPYHRKLARKYLALPVTAAPAQRAFDIKGHLALLEKLKNDSEMLPERVLLDENMEHLSNVSWEGEDTKQENMRLDV